MELDVEKMIRVVRSKQVLLDRDIATLYGVETRVINQAVKRNMERFPERNCFQLTELEFSNWKSQIVMSNSEKMGLRKMPFAFTEQGVAMLSAVLRTKTAIKVSLAIMDAFVQLRHLMMGNGGLINRLSNVEAKDLEQDCRLTGHDKHLLDHDRKFDELFEAMERARTSSANRHETLFQERNQHLEPLNAFEHDFVNLQAGAIIYEDAEYADLVRDFIPGNLVILCIQRFLARAQDQFGPILARLRKP